MDWLRSFSIQSRLWFLLAVSIGCIIAVQIVDITNSRSHLLDARQQTVQ